MKLLVDKKGRKHLVEGEKFQTDLGIVDLNSAADVAKSHLGHEFYVLNPKLIDIYEKMPRSGSFILKKDLGAILAYTGVGSGDVVVDAGTGSGALALFLANIVKPNGRVYTYEINEKFAEIARKNIEKAGLQEYIELKIKDIAEGIKEKNVDLVTLDLEEPWKVFAHAKNALKRGGFIAIYTPYIEHAKRTVEVLREESFKSIKTLELLERELEFREKGTRPRTRMLGHTAYITFARKY
ncbi:MAG: tRNA (adenine-N1)-methyltransferase [Euryarchaeota archaeon]|nr:tRNA (adenine-N1)-methyltransferase [Euryarchaeota archaeon]